jgi:hypothetical protein
VADPQSAVVPVVPDLAEFEVHVAGMRAYAGLNRRPIEVDIVIAGKQRHFIARCLEILERFEYALVSGQNVFQLGNRFLLRAPEIRRVEAITLWVHLNEFEEVPVDDEFDVPGKAFGLAACEVRN